MSPPLPSRVLAVLLAAALLGMALAAVLLVARPTVSLAAESPAARRPLRLGLAHARPRLCLVDEPAQRDLRVLRMAYGVMQVPAARLDWPWFYRVLRSGRGAEANPKVRLDTEALWGSSAVRLLGTHPKFPRGGADRLAPWRDWIEARLPQVQPEALRSLVQWMAPAPAVDPFFPSRLAGSRLWPFEQPRNGPGPVDTCRSWPAGVTFLPSDDTAGYEMRIERASVLLRGYPEPGPLWRDYFRGRLDALWLEADDYDGQLRRYRASQLGAWGAMPGTQQTVLRFAPTLAARLGHEGRQALSLALARERLAQVPGPGRFVPATTYLAPLQSLTQAEGEGLAWDTRRARRLWLQGQHAARELRLIVLEHPLLERLAARMQEQWKRTLNLVVTVQPVPADRFYRVAASGEADLVLDVVDLDDGSLQDLWLASLRELRAPLPGDPAGWEAALRAKLPYLPLVGNVHAVLLRRDASQDLLERVCPGCVPVDSPRRPAPEPREREDPQG